MFYLVPRRQPECVGALRSGTSCPDLRLSDVRALRTYMLFMI